jgi:hypothetical protein
LKIQTLMPHDAVGGQRFGFAVVDVGAQRVQRHAAFAIPFGAGDFAPPRRPPQVILMPSAPRRMADCTARFMARRKATRRSSCWAMPCATSLASISGLRISTMFR